MARLIDKDIVVEEIERRLWLLVPKMTFHQQREELEKLLSFINTLEVKDVDLEKEIKRFTMSKELFEADSVIKAVAEHFFELGIKAQKGE